MSKEISVLVRDTSEAPAVIPRIHDLLARGLKAGAVVVTFGREKRSPAANRKMWAMCRDLSRQVVWHGMTLSDEDWKAIISAEVEAQRIVPGISIPFIALGVSTRRKPARWFSDFFEQAYAFGAEQGVEWSGDSLLDWAADQKEAA